MCSSLIVVCDSTQCEVIWSSKISMVCSVHFTWRGVATCMVCELPLYIKPLYAYSEICFEPLTFVLDNESVLGKFIFVVIQHPWQFNALSCMSLALNHYFRPRNQQINGRLKRCVHMIIGIPQQGLLTLLWQCILASYRASNAIDVYLPQYYVAHAL